MHRIAFAFLSAFVLASLGLLASPAKAGDYYNGDGYYDDGYNGGGYYGHRYHDVGYYGHRHYGDGYYGHRYYSDGYYHHRHHGNTWYTSNCCYRRVVRHTAWYERTYNYGYNGDGGYYGHHYYGDGHYGRSYYRSGYYGHPYYHHYYGDYGYRSYNHYLGYDSVGYASYDSCGRIRLADGRGGWVWSRRAGCF